MRKFSFKQLLVGWGAALVTVAVAVYLFGAERVWAGLGALLRWATGGAAPAVLAGVLALGVAACSDPDRADFDSDEAFQQAVEQRGSSRQERLERMDRISDVALAFARTQVETYRNLGVDVVIGSPEQRMFALAGCSTLVGAVQAGRAFIDSDPDTELAADEVTEDSLQWCVELVKVAAPATDPAPPPKP